MPKPNLNEVVSLGDPALSDNFEVIFEKTPLEDHKIEEYFSRKENNGAVIRGGSPKTPTSLFRLHCKTVGLPTTTMDEVEVRLYGHVVRYAARQSHSGSFSIEFHEDTHLKISSLLRAWADICSNMMYQAGHFRNAPGQTDKFSSTGYAGKAVINVFDVAGKHTAKYQMEGVWPKEIGEVQFDGSGANLLTINATFNYDVCVVGEV